MARSGITGAVDEAPPPATAAITPRRAIAAMFAAFGLAVGLWSGASATILSRCGVDAAAFGVALTLNVAIYLIAMSSGGAFARYFTAKRILVVSAPLMGLAIAALLSADDAVALFAWLALSGFIVGLVDLMMNAEGTKVEKRLGRPILAGLHGAASGGLAIGAIAGSLIVNSAIPALAAIAAFAALTGAGALVALVIPDAGLEHAAPDALPAGRLFSRALIVIGLVLGVCIACETSAMVWSSLLLQKQAPAFAAISGLGAAFFAACQAMLRFNADRIRRALSDRAIIIASLACAAVGFLVVAANVNFATSVAGFAIIGLGAGAVVPCGFAMAVAQPSVTPSAALSSVAMFGTFARLPAPLVVGAIASAMSLSRAFAVFALLLAAAIAAMILFTDAKTGRRPA